MDPVDLPVESWELGQLADYVKNNTRRRATEVWHTGHALSIAQAKHTKGSDKSGLKNFRKWLKDNLEMSRSSAYRYIELYKSCTLEEIGTMSLQDAYNLAEAKKPGTSKPKAQPSVSKELKSSFDRIKLTITRLDPGKLPAKQLTKLKSEAKALIELLRKQIVNYKPTKKTAKKKTAA